MAGDQDNLQPLAVANACFFALIIYFRYIKRLLIIRKPQHAFKRVLADNSYSQFKHLKRQGTDSHSDGEKSNLHPYEAEINDIIRNPNLEFLNIIKGCKNPSTNMDDSYVWVETRKQLRDLVEVLNNEKVFAVDTEQHSERSFLGFIALVQISTISKDYLVDTIILHDMMEMLRPVFANPGICKVFHGASGGDVRWLQRDFHIYIVNLFDTQKAYHVLSESKPQAPLADLLDTYCSFTKNRTLQRADWRRRPLPENMLHYARADTCYLLHITYRLCLELVLKTDNPSPGDEFHFIREASRGSNAICLKLFKKKPIGGIISSSVCDTKPQEIASRLHLWTDVMARLHDENPGFVLSKKAIIALAAEIPTTETNICSIICKADSGVESPSAVVCSHLEDLLWLLQDNIGSLDSIFQMLILRHLGPTRRCPLSAYNYALLSLVRTNTITSGHNGSEKVVKKLASGDLFQKKSLKVPLYEEYAVHARTGQLLRYVDRCERDRIWRELEVDVTHEDEGPPYYTFLFDFDAGPNQIEFALQTKKNKCVGCGEGENHEKYNLIPRVYRRCFRGKLKSGLSHDIVLVCGNCKKKAVDAATMFKKQVAARFEGNGPHGKHVLEHILLNFGNSEICDFCKGWQQVFIEAVNPRFWPDDWPVDD